VFLAIALCWIQEIVRIVCAMTMIHVACRIVLCGTVRQLGRVPDTGDRSANSPSPRRAASLASDPYAPRATVLCGEWSSSLDNKMVRYQLESRPDKLSL
jgi:hypothetical protein